jgi:hypothetical protein
MTETPNKYKTEPARFDHARRVLAQMVLEAGPDNPVWTGNLTALFKNLGLHIPAYTEVRKLLINAGAIRQQKRGGGGSPSQWIIDKTSLETDELWYGQGELNKDKDKPEPIQQRYNDMNHRLNVLERKVEELYAVIRAGAEVSEV